jgi:signal transduction histidine kinase
MRRGRKKIEKMRSMLKSAETETEVQILATIGDLMGTAMPLEEVMATALRVVSVVMGADGASLLLADPEQEKLKFYIALGEKADSLRSITLKRGEGVAGFVAETGKAMVVPDVAKDPRFSRRVDDLTGFTTRSLVCVPLRLKGEPIGVIEAVSQRARNFGAKDVDLLTAIAGPVAIMLDHARSLAEIKGLHDRLVVANRLKTEFLATMTHELRTPISIVMGNIDLLLSGFLGALTTTQTDSLKTALRNSSEALTLITSILDLSRIEAGQFVVRAEEFSLEDLWAELELLFRNALGCKPVDLHWRVKAPLPRLKTDALKVKEILSNIVLNAIKFTDRGSVTVSAFSAPERQAVAVEVRDTGIGIAKDFLPFIFEPFRQGERALTRAHGGVGLGLSIAKRLADLLGGVIEVESEAGKGSTFRLFIPTNFGGLAQA